MKNSLNYVVLILCAILLNNCAPSHYILDPDENSTFEMGRKVVEKEDEIAYSSVTFEEHVQNNFIFHIFVHKKEQDDFVFDPSNIYSKYYDENKNLINSKRYYAFDPEMQIDGLNKSIKEREDLHETVTGLNILFSLFDTVIDLSDDEDNNTEEVIENLAIFTENQVNEEIDYESDIDYLKASRDHWKNDAIRKTELSTEENAQGIIYMPFKPSAVFVKLFLPIGNTTHIYKFKQVKID